MNYVTNPKPTYNSETQICYPKYTLFGDTFTTEWIVADKDPDGDALVPIDPEMSYGEKVNSRIRSRYSVADELAILRQRDAKPEEYAEYYAFCEKCKEEVNHGNQP